MTDLLCRTVGRVFDDAGICFRGFVSSDSDSGSVSSGFGSDIDDSFDLDRGHVGVFLAGQDSGHRADARDRPREDQRDESAARKRSGVPGRRPRFLAR